MATIKFQTKPAPGRLSLADVPDEVKEDIEATYAQLRENPEIEPYIDDFADKKAAQRWANQVRTYCASREGGVLKFRILPSKGMPDTYLRFALTADLPENAKK